MLDEKRINPCHRKCVLLEEDIYLAKNHQMLHQEKDFSLKIIGEDIKLQTLHLISNAAYERKRAHKFLFKTIG